MIGSFLVGLGVGMGTGNWWLALAAGIAVLLLKKD